MLSKGWLLSLPGSPRGNTAIGTGHWGSEGATPSPQPFAEPLAAPAWQAGEPSHRPRTTPARCQLHQLTAPGGYFPPSCPARPLSAGAGRPCPSAQPPSPPVNPPQPRCRRQRPAGRDRQGPQPGPPRSCTPGPAASTEGVQGGAPPPAQLLARRMGRGQVRTCRVPVVPAAGTWGYQAGEEQPTSLPPHLSSPPPWQPPGGGQARQGGCTGRICPCPPRRPRRRQVMQQLRHRDKSSALTRPRSQLRRGGLNPQHLLPPPQHSPHPPPGGASITQHPCQRMGEAPPALSIPPRSWGTEAAASPPHHGTLSHGAPPLCATGGVGGGRLCLSPPPTRLAEGHGLTHQQGCGQDTGSQLMGMTPPLPPPRPPPQAELF